jgi:NAD(P)-dependent dehydrogenase (short-subunit alcohol dehydrogenase family)
MQSSHPLLGQVALVTGGARRIGRAIVQALGEAGADVALTGRASSLESEEAVQAIKNLGRRAMFIAADVRSESAVRAAVSTVVEDMGRLDLLVNNAARFEQANLAEISLEQWDAIFETNTRGPFLMARESIAHLRKTQGRIINIGSLGGLNAWATHAHYCASKAALHKLSEAMAKAFAPEVSVNCVAPGWIEFPAFDQKTAEYFASITPMQRNGCAEDVAVAVLFFATGPHFITGQTLVVDGGLGL